MPVLVTCKFDDDPMKNKGAIHNISSGDQGQLTPKSMAGYGWNLNHPRLCALVTCNFDNDTINTKGVFMPQHFLHYISL